MTALTNYAEVALLDHLLSNTALTSPATVYAKAHIGDPGEDGTGNPATVTTRIAMSFAAAAAGSISNNAQTLWDPYSASETITHISIWDAATAGNCLAYGALTSGITVNNGDPFSLESGDVTVSFARTMLTTYAANALLDHLLRNTAMAQPAGHFVKNHLGVPGTDASANPAAETTRAAVTFAAASAGTAASASAASWTGVAATETWSHLSVWDTVGPAGGNPLLHGAWNAAKVVNAGLDAAAASGAITATLA